MPSPSAALTTTRPELAGSLMEFELDMERQGFIALKAAPVMEVAQATGIFGKIPIEELLKEGKTLRAPGAGYNRMQFTFTSDSFLTQEHGVEEVVDDNQARMYREFFDAELVAARRARSIIMRAFEKRVADLLGSTATWTGSALTTAVSTAWSTTSSATPVTDVEAAKIYVKDNCGMEPNAMIIGWKAFNNLRLNTTSNQLIDRIKYSGHYNPAAKYLSAEVIGEAFDLKHVLVAGAMRNSANEGQSASLTSCWSNDNVMVCKIAETSDIEEPCIARTFHWGEDGSTIGATVESYRDEARRGEVIRCRMQTDEKVLYTECGHLLTNINGGTA